MKHDVEYLATTALPLSSLKKEIDEMCTNDRQLRMHPFLYVGCFGCIYMFICYPIIETNKNEKEFVKHN